MRPIDIGDVRKKVLSCVNIFDATVDVFLGYPLIYKC